MQVPLPGAAVTKDPQPAASFGLHTPVVAADRGAAPPTGFNALRSPTPRDAATLAAQPEHGWWAIARDRDGVQLQGWGE